MCRYICTARWDLRNAFIWCLISHVYFTPRLCTYQGLETITCRLTHWPRQPDSEKEMSHYQGISKGENTALCFKCTRAQYRQSRIKCTLKWSLSDLNDFNSDDKGFVKCFNNKHMLFRQTSVYKSCIKLTHSLVHSLEQIRMINWLSILNCLIQSVKHANQGKCALNWKTIG